MKNYRFDKTQYENWKPIIDNQGARRVLNRTKVNKGVELLPGLFSDEPRTLRAMTTLQYELYKAFPPVVNDVGICDKTAIANNWTKLFNVAGYSMNPNSLPPLDNQHARNEIGMTTTAFKSPEHREILAQVVKYVCGAARPARLSMRRQASMGAPYFINDVPLKKELMRHALSNVERILHLVDEDNLIGLFTEFNAPIVQLLGERVQPDVCKGEPGHWHPKERWVNLEEYVRHGNVDARIIADKSFSLNGNVISDHWACRRRVVYGMSFVVNYLVAAVFAQLRAAYLEEFAFTWKHRTHEEIEQKIANRKYFAGFDVTQMDSTVPAFLVDATCDEMEKYLDPRFVKLIRLMFRAPFIAPYPYNLPAVGAPINPLFGESPFDVGSFTMNLGLPSGIACNPDCGKIFMMFQYLCLINDFTGDVLTTGVDKILRGEHPNYAFLNAGDDCVILMNDEKLFAHVRDGKYHTDYFKVEPETPISFLGAVFYDDGQRHRVCPNIESLLVNWLVPEKGIDHYSRRNFWAIGDVERRSYYAKAPSYGEVWRMYDRIFTTITGTSPTMVSEEIYRQQLVNMSLSTLDLLVLQNPSYLHYKVDERDVSADLLDLIVTSIPAEEVVPCVQPIFGYKIEGDLYGKAA